MDKRGWTAFDVQEPEESTCVYGYILIFHVYRSVIVEAWEKRHATPMYTHWKPIPRKGWIAAADRPPMVQDADIMHCVLARHEWDGIRVTGWHQVTGDKRYTHWMPTPEPPVDGAAYRKRF